jgi:hypothetical protein
MDKSVRSIASLALQIDPLWPSTAFIDGMKIVYVDCSLESAYLGRFNVIICKFVVT